MMKTKDLIKLLLTSIYLFFNICMAESDIEIRTKNNHADSEIIATNKNPYKISVQLTLTESNNIQSDRNWPFIVVISPNTSASLARVYPLDVSKAWSYNFKSKHFIGEYTDDPVSNSLYSLPFEDGKSFQISQAFGDTLTTHDNERERYAVDIAMPIHTPIFAARSGTVVATESKFTEGGKDEIYRDTSNYIKIIHDDGTTASYIHLEHNGVLVDKGQWVNEGDLIGYSGSTGLSSGPHLHFGIARLAKVQNELAEVSVPFQFYVGDPPIAFTPLKNQWIKSVYDEPVEMHQQHITSQDSENISSENLPHIDFENTNIQNLDQNESTFIETLVNLFYVFGFIIVLYLAFRLFYNPSRKN